MKNSCVFIYNLCSGNGRIKKYLKYINKELSKEYSEVILYETKSKEDLKNILLLSVNKYDLIIFSGGDGTFNNVINVLAPLDNIPLLGYIPTGTMNDIAHNIGIKKNIKKSLELVKNNKVVDYNIYRANERYFGYVCGCGTYTSISYDISQKFKSLFGRLAYCIRAIKDLFKKNLVNANINIDNKEIVTNTPLILILNSKYVGGFKINKKYCSNSNDLDIIIIKKGFWNSFRVLWFLITGVKRDHTKLYDHYKGKDVIINTNAKIFSIDGEREETSNLKISFEKRIKILSK